jgi:biotin carboxyl carrier protein
MKKFKFKIHGNNYDVDVKKHEGNIITVEVNGSTFNVELEREIVTPKTPTLVQVAVPPPTRKESKIQKNFVKTANLAVKSPLPGIILKVLVKVGDTIKIGDKVMILEAMKMENSVLA